MVRFFRRGQRAAQALHYVPLEVTTAPWPPYPTEADDQYCPVCEDRYGSFRADISYESVAAALPKAGQHKRAGEQRAHHGDVLRMMGILKTNAWRDRHGACMFPKDEELCWAEHFGEEEQVEHYAPAWRWERLEQQRWRGFGPRSERAGAVIERRAFVHDQRWSLIVRVTYPSGGMRQRTWMGTFGGQGAVWAADLQIGGLGGRNYVRTA